MFEMPRHVSASLVRIFSVLCFFPFIRNILTPVSLQRAEFNADAAFIQRIERQLRQAYGEKLGNTDRLRPADGIRECDVKRVVTGGQGGALGGT